jgi:hypothetical protein
VLALGDSALEAFRPPEAAAFAVRAVRGVTRGRATFNSFVYIFIFIAGIACYRTLCYSTPFLSARGRKVYAVDTAAALSGVPALHFPGPLNPPREYQPLNGDLSLPRAHIARHGKGLVADGAFVLPEAAGEPVEAQEDKLVVRVQGRKNAVKDAVRDAAKGVWRYSRTCYSRRFYGGIVRR